MIPKLLIVVAASFAMASCGQDGHGEPMNELSEILAERKFEPHGFYTGVDLPEDQEPLTKAVDSAIKDILAMPEPLDDEAVRARLNQLIEETDFFATEDRDEAYRYAIRIWRAAGFESESKLFPANDDRVLRYFP